MQPQHLRADSYFGDPTVPTRIANPAAAVAVSTAPDASIETSNAAPPTRSPETASAPTAALGRRWTTPPGTSASMPRRACTITTADAAAHAWGRQEAG